MPKFSELICPSKAGLYCPPGGFHIDPIQPVDRAVITHGHGDHARSGHRHVLATRETLAIMACRYGDAFAGESQIAAYGEQIVQNGVELSLIPAGHILGSAQILLRWQGMRVLVSGDYKRRRDPTCAGYEPAPCDLFISEATFGLPIFRHPEDGGEIQKLLQSLRQFPERTHLVGAYALGKAQRLIALLRAQGYDRPIYVHGALQSLNALYERFGVALRPLLAATSESKEKRQGEIVIAPPSAIADRWTRRFADPLPAFASGWMRVRARARQRGIELPLILSDHGDWDELTGTIEELQPQELWVTHGSEDALLRWAQLKGIRAKALELVGYEDEEAA